MGVPNQAGYTGRSRITVMGLAAAECAGRRIKTYLRTLLFWAALCFFLWMFVASEGLERTARAGRFAGGPSPQTAAAAEGYALEWRHGMVGGWPIYVPGFFAVAITAVLWSRQRSIRGLVIEGGLAIVVALVAAEILAPLGTRWVIHSFEADTGVVLQGSSRGASGRAALPGLVTLVSWIALIVAAQVCAARRSIWPLAVPLVCYSTLAVLRPGDFGDLVRPWGQAVWHRDGAAILSTALIPAVAVLLWSHASNRGVGRRAA